MIDNQLETNGSAWLSDARRRLQELSGLQENWNSYGAKAIDRKAIDAAEKLLRELASPLPPRLQIVPLVSGGVQIEWHANGIDLEIAVRASEPFVVSYENVRTGEAWEREITAEGN